MKMGSIQFWIVLAVILVSSSEIEGKTFSRCEMYKKLQSGGFNDIKNWVCLIEKESGLRTDAVGGPNGDGSKDYGLFQINSRYWCGKNKPGGDCNIKCSKLIDDNPDDDMRCAKKIYGRHKFDAWNGWKSGCRGKSVAKYGC